MNCIIVHGGPLTDMQEEPHHLHELYWQPWVKEQLESRGVATVVPAMPNPWVADYQAWKARFEKETITVNTVLVGHSRGCAFLLRWLSEIKQSVQKIVLIAPNLETESVDPTLKEFYTFTIDEGIADRVPKRIVFTSENDDQENVDSAQLIAEKLHCQTINLPQHGHSSLKKWAPMSSQS